VTAVTAKVWGTSVNVGTSYAVSTGRITNNTTYDAAGNVVAHTVQTSPTVINQTMTYDAAGRQVETYDPLRHTCCENNHTYDNTYDGNGWLAKEVDVNAPPSGPSSTVTIYKIRSTVLGGELVGEYNPYTDYPQKKFIVPVVGGKLTYTNIVNYSENVVFSRTSPEGLLGYEGDSPVSNYDPRGADVGIDDPGSTGGFVDGSYPRGNDPAAWDRCAEGGVPTSCDKQAKFDKRGDELIARIREEEKEKRIATEPAPHGSSPGSDPQKIHEEKHESSGAHQTTSTDKPEDDPETSGAVSSASDPCVDGYDKETDTTRVCTSELRVPTVDTSKADDGDPVPSKLLDRIRGELNKIANLRCRTALRTIFYEASQLTKGTRDADQAVSSNPVDLFDLVRKQGGFYFSNNSSGPSTYAGYSTGSGAVGANDAKVILSAALASSSTYSINQIHAIAYATLSELVHVAGSKPSFYYGETFSDVNLAMASHNLGLGAKNFASFDPTRKGMFLTQYPGDAGVDPKKDKFFHWSQYNHDSIKQYCH
jgi:YD repeat-containing protein